MNKDGAKSNKEKKNFFKDFKAELKKVIWPTPKQVANNTIAVVTIVVVTAVIVFALDLAFEALNTYGIDKIRNVVTSNEISENSVINTVEDAAENATTNTVENEIANTVENNTVSE